jgi:hypothetical protein
LKDLKEKVRKVIKESMWLVLTTLDKNNIPYSSVLVYQSDGNTIICQTGEDTLKANNVRGNKHVAVTIPIRKNLLHKIIPAPPAEIHFTTTAEIIQRDDKEAKVIFSKYLTHTEKSNLPQDYIWLKILIPSKVTTYGVGVPLLKMRNPLIARKHVQLD